MDRRAFLLQSLLAGMARGAEGRDAQGQLRAWLGKELEETAKRWDETRAGIRHRSQQEERNRLVRRQVRQMLGVERQREPVAVQARGRLERDGYAVERLLFETMKGVWAPANLYVPAGKGPFPGVISPCGHYESSRMHADYQRAHQAMARSGLVVLTWDPPGQGERRQYFNAATGKNDDGLRSVDEHSMAGHLLLLMGENLTGWMVREGMRALDVLQARAEVDRRNLACAGHSGGGTLTMFLACAEPRIRYVVINEGGTMHRWPVQWKADGTAPLADAEQNLFPAAQLGIDNCDLHLALAPRPLLALIENYTPDFEQTAKHIRNGYELLGAGANFAVDEAQAKHAWTEKLRLVSANWLSRHMLGRAGVADETGARIEKEEELWATPRGMLRGTAEEGGVFAYIRERGQALEAKRKAPPGAEELKQFREGLRGRLPDLLRMPAPTAAAHLHVEEKRRAGAVEMQLGHVETESGLALRVTTYATARGRKSPVVELLFDEAAHEAGAAEALQLAQRGHFVCAVDVRGVVAKEQAKKPFAHLVDQETSCAYMAWYLDKDLFGMRVADVLQALRCALLGKPKTAVLRGRGAAGLWVLCAAALETRVERVVSTGSLASYFLLTQTDRHEHGAANFARSLLAEFDLPQIAAAVAPREVSIVGAVDARRRPLTQRELERAYLFTRGAFAAVGAGARLRLCAEATCES